MTTRLRRLRLSPPLRRMMRETVVTPDDFVAPLFVTFQRGAERPIASMPGIAQWPVEKVAREAESIGLSRPLGGVNLSISLRR